MTKVIIMIMAGAAMLDVIAVKMLAREHEKRKKAEDALFEAEERIGILNKMLSVKQEARHEADKKIDEVRNNSGRGKFDAIMRGMQDNTKHSAGNNTKA